MKLSEHRKELLRQINGRHMEGARGRQWEDIGDLLDIVEFLQVALEEEYKKRERWLGVVAALGIEMMRKDT